MAGETYSERIVEDYPKLSRSGVIKLLGEHGLKVDQPTLTVNVSRRDDPEYPWDDSSTFDAEFGVRETYRTSHIMAWIGY